MSTNASKPRSLMTKLLVFILCLIYFPLLMIIYFLGDVLSRQQFDQNEALLLSTLQQAVDNIDADIAFVESAAYSYATDSQLQYYISYDYAEEKNIEMQLVAHRYLENRLYLAESSRFLLSKILLFTNNKSLWVSGKYNYPISWLSTETIDAVNRTIAWWTLPSRPPFTASVLKGTTLSDYDKSTFYFCPIRSYGVPCKGVIAIQIPLRMFTQYWSSIPGDSMLVTQDGQIVTSELHQGDQLMHEAKTALNAGQYHFQTMLRSQTTMCYLFPLANGWTLLQAVPQSALLLQSVHIRLFALGIALLVGMMLLFLVVFMQQTVSRRTKKLLISMKHIQEGDFNAAPPVNFISRPDELSSMENGLGQMAKKLQHLVNENYALALQKKDAQLRMLQAQINPHLLYNSLSTIKWMTLENSASEIREAVDALASFYRISLNKGRDMITIEDEVRCTKAYLKIQQYRTKGMVRAYFQLDESLLTVLIPKLTLQPIVENSVLHGPIDGQPLSIMISLTRESETLLLSVKDDGRGMTPEQASALLAGKLRGDGLGGFGLYNVQKRLELFSNGSAALNLITTPGYGTEVQIRLNNSPRTQMLPY